MSKRVEVTTAHRNAAAELTLRTLDGEPFCCQRHYEEFIGMVARQLAKGKTVMLKRDGQGVAIKLFTR